MVKPVSKPMPAFVSDSADISLLSAEALVSECATRVHYDLMREQIEPGTKEAFEAYVASLRQLYLFGVAIQLHRMGYHMERV